MSVASYAHKCCSQYKQGQACSSSSGYLNFPFIRWWWQSVMILDSSLLLLSLRSYTHLYFSKRIVLTRYLWLHRYSGDHLYYSASYELCGFICDDEDDVSSCLVDSATKLYYGHFWKWRLWGMGKQWHRPLECLFGKSTDGGKTL